MPFVDKDFAHISLLATGPNVLAVNPEFPAKTFKEFITLAKANPGKYANASSGSGSSGHLAMEMVKQSAGIDVLHVPYKGGAAAITDVIGGQIPMLFINQDNALPQVQSANCARWPWRAWSEILFILIRRPSPSPATPASRLYRGSDFPPPPARQKT